LVDSRKTFWGQGGDSVRVHTIITVWIYKAGNAQGIRSAGILDNTLPQRGAGNNAGSLDGFVGPLSFITAEEEETILHDRTADPRAESIAMENARHIGFAGLYLGLFVEPVIGLANVGPVVLVQGSMKTVGTTLSDHVDLSAGRAPGVCIGVGRRNSKFLNGIEWNPEGALKSEAL
jgi:hypothetical protein